jgi:HAE1 family hydrophobic/amphiphilic exporter-1
VRKTALFGIVTAISAQLAFAQNPPVSPAQRDATRPPGTESNKSIPPQARPITQDPTAAPGTERPAPSAAPGTTLPSPSAQPVTPSNVSPATPLNDSPATTPPPSTQPAPGSNPSDIQEPVLPNVQPRPVPPVPDLSRLGVDSSNAIPLSLNDAIRRALQNNNDIEVSRNDVRIAETTLRSLEGIYQPLFSINPQYSSRVQAQQSTLGGATSNAGTVAQTDYIWNSSINKQFGTGGGNYSLFFNNDRSSTNSSFNQLNPVYASSFGIQFTQPLLRNRSIDNNRRQIRIQRKRVSQSDADFRRKTIETITGVQRAYWDLVFAFRNLDNRIANLNLTRESLRNVEARIAAGAAAPLERAEVQTQLANRESDLLLASQQISIAENVLKALIIKDSTAPEWSAQLNPTDSPLFDSSPVDLRNAIADAMKNRPELQRLRLQGDINKIDIQYFRNQTRPQIDLQSTFALTGLSGAAVLRTQTGPIIGNSINTDASAFLLDQINKIRQSFNPPLGPVIVPVQNNTFTNAPGNLIGGYGKDLSNLFNGSTRNIVVGVAIQFPLKNQTAQANLAGARFAETQREASTRLQEQTVEAEVRNAAQAVETTRRIILTARAARENAELQLQGEQKLYQVGRSTTFLLFQREDTLASARAAEIQAQTDYSKALAELQRATATTLSTNNIVVEEPASKP